MCRPRSMIKPFGDADMQISLVEYGADWARLGGAAFTMPHSFFNPHDFAITPSHYIFFQARGGRAGSLLLPFLRCLRALGVLGVPDACVPMPQRGLTSTGSHKSANAH